MTDMHRAHHVGSLLRPAALREAWRNAEPDALRQAQDAAIRDVVAMQEEIGLARRHRRRVPAPLVLEPVRRAGRGARGGRGAVLVHGRVGRPARLHGTPCHGAGPSRGADLGARSRVRARRSPTATSRSPCRRHRPCSSGSAHCPASTSRRRRSSPILPSCTSRRSPTSPRAAPRSSSSTRSRSRCSATRLHATVVAAAGEDPEQLVDDYVAAIARSLATCAVERHDRHACLSRELQGPLDGERWLRARGREGVRAERCRDAVPRVRLGAVGKLRPVALRAREHDGRARLGQLEDTGARVSATTCCAGSTRRRRSCRSSDSRCLRSVGSRRPSAATRSPKTTRSASSHASSKCAKRCGGRHEQRYWAMPGLRNARAERTKVKGTSQ